MPLKDIDQINKTIDELCGDYDIRLVKRDEKTVGVDVPLEEFMDVMAKKSALIVIKKFLRK